MLTTLVMQPCFAQSEKVTANHSEALNMDIRHFDIKITPTNNASRSIDTEKADLESYRIFVATPKQSAPQDGWPVVWLLDGNMTFDYAVKNKPEAIIVAIGYPLDNRDEIVTRRYYGLTEKAGPENFPHREGKTPPNTGGRAAFSRFIMDDLRPLIKKQYNINDNQQILYGHSLGGLFVLHEMLDGRQRYNIYCAADPSIWWSKHGILERFKAEPLFADTNNNQKTYLLISASGKRAQRAQLSPEEAKKLAETRGGPNGKYVFDLLKQYPFIEENYQLYENDSHGTMVEPSVHDCLKFAKIKLNND
ncbi:alpha/beta hydrolase [Bartonella sp. HY406]|uniref:alpha/beta hydrolase n=1 Tax=Bartonella sp. HY406 TaxID=2979331 RepID=UPI0021C63290|nr:alpha/beta hydrolase-fold protein [Bartonella sp. HY406]UXN03971.1 alpha/beta hydrolase-fold protein [Bartonella sp. HY406]